MEDEFSNFKSATHWPEQATEEQIPTGELKPLVVGVLQFIEYVASSFEISGLSESPIETLLGARLALYFRKHLPDDFDVAIDPIASSKAIILQPQKWIDKFRYDFAILYDKKSVILIECDGKDFHSQPDQIENDERKNKAALDTGICLLRFTGSEIHSDVDSCVRITINALRTELLKLGVRLA